jgi:hypothetical protein
MGLIFRLVGLVGLLLTLGVLGLAGIAGYFLLAGGASRPDCAAPETGVLESAAASLAFDARLTAFVATGGRPPVSGATFEETEAAARAERFFEDRTDRISDIALCFEDGKATGFVRFETAFGRKVGVRAEGTLDLAGDHPVLRLTHTSAAGVPAPGFLRGEIEDVVNRELKEITLVFPMQLMLSEGEATLTRPSPVAR